MEDNNQHEIADLLRKAIIEDFIVEIIDYFYPELEKSRDKTKRIEFLDKFLKTLNPEGVEGNRRADLLVKVPLKNGEEKWILLHIEVQGYQDSNLARRMFTYYYRSLDKFGVPVEALVIFTDTNKKYRPDTYVYQGFKTKCIYKYNIFKLVDYKFEDFDSLETPVGIIFQTALIGMQRNLKDEELLELKMTLYRSLLNKGYSKEKVGVIGSFIRDLIRFKKSEYNSIFVETVNKIENNNKVMGVIDTINEYREKKGKEIGKALGKELGIFISKLEDRIAFLNKFRKRNFTDEDLAEMFDVTPVFVKDFRKAFTLAKMKQLNIAIKKSKEMDELIVIKTYLIKSMIKFGFSRLALMDYFKLKESELAQIIPIKK